MREGAQNQCLILDCRKLLIDHPLQVKKKIIKKPMTNFFFPVIGNTKRENWNLFKKSTNTENVPFYLKKKKKIFGIC